MSHRDTQAGLTMVEIMISLLLVSVAAAFVFSIQMRTSTALRDQQAIAEMQQTLRATADAIVRDVRGAGYLARSIRVTKEGGSGSCVGAPDGVNTVDITGISVDNNNAAPDIVRIASADASVQAFVTSHTTESSVVDSVAGFAVDDRVLLVSVATGGTTYGVGCVIQITGIDAATKTLSHASGVGINYTTLCQCDAIATAGPWMITRLSLKAYRINPNDARGVLQMSPSGGVTPNDWVDLAVGIVDLQLALRIAQPGDGTDEDGDLAPQRDWRSGDNMEATLAPTESVVAASVTLVAKTTKEVNGIELATSPDVFAADAGISNNRVGDRAGTPLPVTDPTSMFYGNFVYRSYSTVVDLRNIGVGAVDPTP